YLAEARRTYKPDIANDAWISFIDDRIKVIPELASYSESTLKKMGRHVIKALVDTGYLQSTRQRQIQAVYLLPEVKDLLININKQELIDVMECTQGGDDAFGNGAILWLGCHMSDKGFVDF
ncbi:MAG: DUF1819 family protein, partial [Methyloprofundus sp.]|nr:DUF1819 family protein [Methyloprofundus sp.]